MLKLFENAYNYYKYGKIIHRSPSGKVIRKRFDYDSVFKSDRYVRATTKTVFTPEGKIEQTISRNARFYKEKDLMSTSTITNRYDTKTGTLNNPNKYSKDYFFNTDSKKLVDYTKANYDYKKTQLADGKTKYEIAYPEVTIIKDGEVTTSTNNKVYIA